MPGIRFAGQSGGKTFAPNLIMGLMGNSESGNSTATVVGQLWEGDLLALTTNSTYTGGPGVMRQLLAADKTASYQNGSSVVCGIYGVAATTSASNATGQHITPTTLYTGNIPYPYGEAQLYVPDPTTGRGVLPVYSASGNIFGGRIYGGTTRSAATLQALTGGALLGIIIVVGNGTNGVPTGQIQYYIDPAPGSAAVSVARFIGWNAEDPTYFATLGAATPVGWTGSTSPIPATPECFFAFEGAFAQDLTAVPYTAQ